MMAEQLCCLPLMRMLHQDVMLLCCARALMSGLSSILGPLSSGWTFWMSSWFTSSRFDLHREYSLSMRKNSIHSKSGSHFKN